jgi:radical SAM protein with 4Fe4S-binding SPASM domain
MLKEKGIDNSNPREYFDRRTKSLNFFSKVNIEITTKCCLKCVHCYNQVIQNRKEMDYRQICSVLDQLADMGVLFVRLTGGEPLLHNDFWKIIEYTRKKEFAVSISSNGALITGEVAKRLVANSISFVDLSIYGMDEPSYESTTGVKGIFRKAMNAIEQMKKEGLVFSLKTVAMRENFSQLEAFKKMAKKLKVKYRIQPQISPCPDGCKKPLKHGLNYQQLKELFIKNQNFFASILNPPASSNSLVCTNPVSMFINSEGQVLPCSSLFSKDKNMNIRNKTISEIYNKNPLFQLRKKLSWKSIPGCMRCAAFRYCPICAADFIHHSKFSPLPSKEKCKLTWLRKEISEKTGISRAKNA